MASVIGPRRTWKDRIPSSDRSWKTLAGCAKTTLLAMTQEGDKSIGELSGDVMKALQGVMNLQEAFKLVIAAYEIADAQNSLRMATIGMWEAKFIMGVEKFGADTSKALKFARKMKEDRCVPLPSIDGSEGDGVSGLQTFPPSHRHI